MKKLITFLSICTTVAILALPAAARNFIAQPDTNIQDAACTDEAKEALYSSFLKNRGNDEAKAAEDAKKYLACPTTGITEAQTKIVEYLKKWVAKYDEISRTGKFDDVMWVKPNYPVAYQLGKEILTAQPDNLKVLVALGVNGYLVAPLNNPSLSAEALEHAKKALAELEAGKTVDDWKPLASKDVAVSYLNYTIGTLTLQTDPANALKYLIKSAQFDTPLRKSPFTYAYIAGAYETGPYLKLSDEYKAKFSGKDETPESKLMLANINQIIDRMIDGYARAVALAGADPKFAQPKTVWNESLTNWYKYRNSDKTDGLDQLIAGILQKPLPPEPTPLTSLPASTPAATPATGQGVGNANGQGVGNANGQGAGNANGQGVGNANGSGVGNRAASTTTPATKPTAKPDKPRNR